jgi:hypothetical protein
MPTLNPTNPPAKPSMFTGFLNRTVVKIYLKRNQMFFCLFNTEDSRFYWPEAGFFSYNARVVCPTET